jgi:hypothetical protein
MATLEASDAHDEAEKGIAEAICGLDIAEDD